MTAQELAAAFEARRTGTGPQWPDLETLVKQNMAELTEAGLPPAGAGPDECVLLVRTIAGGCGATAFALASACAEENPASGPLFDAAAFLGLAERAHRHAIEAVLARPGTARLPGPQFGVARMRGEIATMSALLDRPGRDPEVARYYLAGAAEQVVSAAMDLAGGADQRVGHAWQDLKQGPLPPFDRYRALELIGKKELGVDPDQRPRWL